VFTPPYELDAGSKGPLAPAYTYNLFDLGYHMAEKGDPWRKVPSSPSETWRAGTRSGQ
jgi:hypothetical protein